MINRRHLCAALALCLLSQTAIAQTADLSEPGADELMFAIENMDVRADPAEDFHRFAAGGWLDRVKRPENLGSYSFSAIQSQRINRQIDTVIAKAVAAAPTAPEGSPGQLVGDFHTAYMDVEGRDARGMAPLLDALDRVAAISSLDDLTQFAARYTAMTGKLFLFGVFPEADLVDGTRYVFWSAPGQPGLATERDVYSAPIWIACSSSSATLFTLVDARSIVFRMNWLGSTS